MPTLAEAIRQRKAQTLSVEEMRSFIIQTAEDVVAKRMNDLEQDIRDEVAEEISEVVNEMLDKKLTGPQGEKGDKGEIGQDGRDGIDGLNGRDGIDGKDGANGIDGKDGAPGAPGKDGSPDTPEQVVEKVNKATTKILVSSIEGLVEEMASIKRAVRERGGGSGGGGGMGQPQHETKSVSSATTTITTTYPIAAGGRAIFPLSYQGQMLAYGTHYTVGADRKTITLLFTPQDNTSIDITYIR